MNCKKGIWNIEPFCCVKNSRCSIWVEQVKLSVVKRNKWKSRIYELVIFGWTAFRDFHQRFKLHGGRIRFMGGLNGPFEMQTVEPFDSNQKKIYEYIACRLHKSTEITLSIESCRRGRNRFANGNAQFHKLFTDEIHFLNTAGRIYSIRFFSGAPKQFSGSKNGNVAIPNGYRIHRYLYNSMQS